MECRQSPPIYGGNCFVHALISVHTTWAHKSTYLSIYLYDIYMRTWCFQQRLGSHFTTPVKMLDSELLSLVVYAMRNWEGMENKIPFQKVYLIRTFFNLHLSIQIGPRNAMWSAGRFFVVSHSTTSRMVLNFQFCSLVGKLIACEIFFSVVIFLSEPFKMKNEKQLQSSL